MTTIAVALADAFAMQNNCRVLLVDLAPSARRRLQLAPPSKAVQPAPFPLLLAADDRVYGRPENYNFDVLSVKNGYRPQEANLQECIPNCRLIYDVIIIDAGPLEDGMPFRLRHLSSATLLVIDARKTTLPMLQQLKKFMQAAEFKIDGVILNRRKFYIPSLLYGLVR